MRVQIEWRDDEHRVTFDLETLKKILKLTSSQLEKINKAAREAINKS